MNNKINYDHSKLNKDQKLKFEKIIDEIFRIYDRSKIDLESLDKIYVVKDELLEEKYKYLSGDQEWYKNTDCIAFNDKIIIRDSSTMNNQIIMHEMIHISDFKIRNQGNDVNEMSLKCYKEYVANRYIDERYINGNKEILQYIDNIKIYCNHEQFINGFTYIPYLIGLIRNTKKDCDDNYITNIISKEFKNSEYMNILIDILIEFNSMYSKFDEVYPKVIPENIISEYESIRNKIENVK